MLKTRNLEPKNWNLFDIVGAYSIVTLLTLKVGLVPIGTTGQIESHLCIGLLLYLKLARVDVGNIRKKGENMEGINT